MSRRPPFVLCVCRTCDSHISAILFSVDRKEPLEFFRWVRTPVEKTGRETAEEFLEWTDRLYAEGKYSQFMVVLYARHDYMKINWFIKDQTNNKRSLQNLKGNVLKCVFHFETLGNRRIFMKKYTEDGEVNKTIHDIIYEPVFEHSNYYYRRYSPDPRLDAGWFACYLLDLFEPMRTAIMGYSEHDEQKLTIVPSASQDNKQEKK